jgi:hypothetical protein
MLTGLQTKKQKDAFTASRRVGVRLQSLIVSEPKRRLCINTRPPWVETIS